jgi:hydrogenase maturation protease
MKTLIAGLGNTLMQDDGVGIYIAEKLERHDEYDVFICGPDVFKIMNVLKDHKRLILIDAIDARLTPGTIICLKESGLFKFDNLTRSSHQISMLEALKLMKLTRPEFTDVEIFFTGVQIGEISLSQSLTEEVKFSAERLIEYFL